MSKKQRSIMSICLETVNSSKVPLLSDEIFLEASKISDRKLTMANISPALHSLHKNKKIMRRKDPNSKNRFLYYPKKTRAEAAQPEVQDTILQDTKLALLKFTDSHMNFSGNKDMQEAILGVVSKMSFIDILNLGVSKDDLKILFGEML